MGALNATGRQRWRRQQEGFSDRNDKKNNRNEDEKKWNEQNRKVMAKRNEMAVAKSFPYFYLYNMLVAFSIRAEIAPPNSNDI